MKFFKYWGREKESVKDARGKWWALQCWSGSDESSADAALGAHARVKELVDKLQRGETLNRYSYGDRPLREEVLRAIAGDRGKEIAVVTRNGYGAEVLNAANAMFIDIDFEEENAPRAALAAQFQRMRGKEPLTQEEAKIEAIEQWAARNPGLDLRVYRTFGGLRCLVTNEVFDPTQESTLGMLRELKSDPLYIRLCRAQGCFRARLSPKPWRCEAGRPPVKFPWENPRAESQYRAWEAKYRSVSARFSVCRPVKEIGRGRVHPDIQPILDVHDRQSISAPHLLLA